jgi:hypothetical protein
MGSLLNLRQNKQQPSPQSLHLMHYFSHLSCITGERSPIGEGSISCGYLMYMYEGGIGGGKRGGLRIPHLSRYNCSSNLEESTKIKLTEHIFHISQN